MSDPYIIRDIRGANVYVNPFQYNAYTNVLRVYKSVTIKVVENYTDPINPMPANRSVTKGLSQVYNSLFINYNQNPQRWTEEIGEFGEILVIYTSRDATAIQDWITWKKEMGYTVYEEQVSTGANVGSTISTAFSAHPNILYVQLVGDWADIESDLGTSYSAPTDPMLGCLVGNDDYHDVIVGRFSAGTTSHVTIQGNKSINYEKNPDLTGTWYETALGIGSEQGSGYGDDDEADYEHIDNIKDYRLMPYHYTTVHEAYQSPTNATVAGYVNDGVGLINYCGHGDHDYWVTSSYSASNVNSSTNGDMLPFVFSVACIVGEFHTGSDCLAEAMLRKDGGGAVATWMSTINQPWTPPMRGQDYANDILTEGYDYSVGNGTATTYGKTTFGSITFNAAALMINESTEDDDWDTYKTWTVFGDASLQVRTRQPLALSLSNPSVTPGSYTTQVTVGGQPFENALVSLYKDGASQPASGLTDASGNVTISHSFTGTVTLTVTGYNLATYQVETPVAVPDPPICDFMADQTTVTAGSTVNFTDLSDNYPSSWAWTFNGGTPTSSTVQNPSIVYNTPGTYDVSLTVNNTAGTDSETKTAYIIVEPVSDPPVADFEASVTNILMGGTVDFTDLSTNLPDSWTWTFDGGTPSSSTAQNPTGIAYNTAGTYTVTLEAGNSFGTDTETKVAYIVVDPPEYDDAGASSEWEYIDDVICGDISNTATGWTTGGYADYTSMNTTMNIGDTYTLTVNIGNVYNSDEVRAWVDWNMDGDFDDTNEDIYASSSLGDDVHTISVTPPAGAVNGNTRLRIRLNDTQSGSNSTPYGTASYGEVEDYTFIVQSPATTAPIAGFDAAATMACAGSSIMFTNQSVDADSYSWTFDGGASGSTAENPSVVFDTPGTYTVELTATNSIGSDAYSMDVTITAAPTVSLSSTDILCNGDNDGAIDITISGGTGTLDYAWSNGATSEDLTGVPAGSYTVTISDDAGCAVTESQVLTEPTALVLSGTVTDEDTYGSGDGSIDLTVIGGTASYSYDWSNGDSSEDLNNITSGTYTVTVTDENGCITSAAYDVSFVNSISTLSADELKLYPNPASQMITIEATENISSVEIVSVTGQLVYSGNPIANVCTIDITKLSAGVYTVKVQNQNASGYVKLIVK